jgi:hypothetical protein
MDPRIESTQGKRSRKRWRVGLVVLGAAVAAAFLFPRRASIRVQTDANLALHWILVPEGMKSSTLLLGRDRDHDSLPELYFQVGEPMGTNWEALVFQGELRPDFIQVLVLELAGSDGKEQQRWPVDFEGPHGHVLGRDTSIHFHVRALNGEDVCLTQERCAGVFAFKSASEYEFLLSGKPAKLVENIRLASHESGNEESWTIQVMQDGVLVRELECGSRARFILRPEYLDRGYCYRMEWTQDIDRTTCVRIDLLTGKETVIELPSIDGQPLNYFLALSSPVQLPNGILVGQAELETEKGVSLFRIPLDPYGPPIEVAHFPQQDAGSLRDLQPQYLDVDGKYLRLSCYFDDTKPDALQIACAFFGDPEHVQSIESIPAMGNPSDPYSFRDLEARVVPDQNGDQIEDIVVMLRLSRSQREAIGYLIVSGATGEILPR